jgi:hypothetical protein
MAENIDTSTLTEEELNNFWTDMFDKGKVKNPADKVSSKAKKDLVTGNAGSYSAYTKNKSTAKPEDSIPKPSTPTPTEVPAPTIPATNGIAPSGPNPISPPTNGIAPSGVPSDAPIGVPAPSTPPVNQNLPPAEGVGNAPVMPSNVPSKKEPTLADKFASVIQNPETWQNLGDRVQQALSNIATSRGGKVGQTNLERKRELDNAAIQQANDLEKTRVINQYTIQRDAVMQRYAIELAQLNATHATELQKQSLATQLTNSLATLDAQFKNELKLIPERIKEFITQTKSSILLQQSMAGKDAPEL